MMPIECSVAGINPQNKRRRDDGDDADARPPKRQKPEEANKPTKSIAPYGEWVMRSIRLQNALNKQRAKEYKELRELKDREAEARRRHRLPSPSPEPLTPAEQIDLAHPEADKYGRRPSMFGLTTFDQVENAFGSEYAEAWYERRRTEYLARKAKEDEMERIKIENLKAELKALKASDSAAYKKRVTHLKMIGRFPAPSKPAARKPRDSADRHLRVKQLLDRRSSEPEDELSIADDARRSRAARAVQTKARATRKQISRRRESLNRSPSSDPRSSRSPSPHMAPVSLSPTISQSQTDMVIDSIEAPLLEELDSVPDNAPANNSESTSKTVPKKASRRTPNKVPKKAPNKAPKKAPPHPPPTSNDGSNMPPALESDAPVSPTQQRRSTRQQRGPTVFYQLDQRGKAQLV